MVLLQLFILLLIGYIGYKVIYIPNTKEVVKKFKDY